MKRFMGLILAGVGAVGTLYGGFYVMTGKSSASLHPVPINALYGGLASVAMLTIGLLWSRE